jgi:Zn-dependent protease with chaperone function
MNTWKRASLISCILLIGLAAVAQTSMPIVPPSSVITSYTLPPDKLAKSAALYTVSVRLLIVDTIFGFLLLLAFIYGRVGPRFRNVAERATQGIWRQGFITVAFTLLLLLVLQVPIEMYGHHLSLAYGLSVQKWGSWFLDWFKSLGLLLCFGTLLISVAYWRVRKSPRRWWFEFWLISIPIVVFVVFIAPVLIEPMFNHFDPLEPRQPQLVSEIEKVTQHGGLAIPRSRMYEMRASEKVTTLNAYVSGIGASKRVVVWDNTIKDMTIPQTLYVFGHEMGHYVLDHIWKGLAFTLLLLLAGLYLGARVGDWAVARYGPSRDIRSLGDFASLPLAILILSLFSFVIGPVGSAFSRHLEHQADQFGLEVTHGIVPDPNQNAAQTFQALGENSLDYPYPARWLVLWTYDHPSIPDRIEFVLHYKPWEEGKQPEFVK